MSRLTMTNGHAPPVTHAGWQTASVRDFFSRIPWSGTPLPLPLSQPGDPLAETVSPLDLCMRVRDYFQAFPWEGEPNIAAPVTPLQLQPDVPPEEDLTLDGFADLF